MCASGSQFSSIFYTFAIHSINSCSIHVQFMFNSFSTSAIICTWQLRRFGKIRTLTWRLALRPLLADARARALTQKSLLRKHRNPSCFACCGSRNPSLGPRASPMFLVWTPWFPSDLLLQALLFLSLSFCQDTLPAGLVAQLTSWYHGRCSSMLKSPKMMRNVSSHQKWFAMRNDEKCTMQTSPVLSKFMRSAPSAPSAPGFFFLPFLQLFFGEWSFPGCKDM